MHLSVGPFLFRVLNFKCLDSLYQIPTLLLFTAIASCPDMNRLLISQVIGCSSVPMSSDCRGRCSFSFFAFLGPLLGVFLMLPKAEETSFFSSSEKAPLARSRDRNVASSMSAGVCNIHPFLRLAHTILCLLGLSKQNCNTHLVSLTTLVHNE